MPISIRDRLEIGLQHSSEEREDTKLRRTGEFFSDKNIDQVSGSLLRIGVTVSALLVLAGAISYLVSYGNTTPHYHIFRGEPSDLTSIGGILKDLLALHPLTSSVRPSDSHNNTGHPGRIRRFCLRRSA